ncbi:MAG: hypothetical protein WKG07_31725 [Hymenobacter sp.]
MPLQRFPFRASFFGIGLCRQGHTELQVNLETYAVRPDSLLLMGPELIRRWTNQSADYSTTALFFTEQFLAEDSGAATLARHFRVFAPGRHARATPRQRGSGDHLATFAGSETRAGRGEHAQAAAH